jgi:hypothetical protein
MVAVLVRIGENRVSVRPTGAEGSMATRREISDPTDRQPSTFQDPQTSKGLNQLFLKTVYLCQARRIFLIADTATVFNRFTPNT